MAKDDSGGGSKGLPIPPPSVPPDPRGEAVVAERNADVGVDHRLPPSVPSASRLVSWYYASDSKRRHDAILDWLWPLLRRAERELGARVTLRIETTLTHAETEEVALVLEEVALLDALCAATTDAEQDRLAEELVRNYWSDWPERMRDDVLRKRVARVKEAAREMGQPQHRVFIGRQEYLRNVREKCPSLLPPVLRLRYFWAQVESRLRGLSYKPGRGATRPSVAAAQSRKRLGPPRKARRAKRRRQTR
jgi:hypothetical protein